MPETWSSAECAAAWGIKPATWLGYVSRGQAPAPLAGPGPRRWDPEAVQSFPRPGVGRSRAGATPAATELLDRMRAVAAELEKLQVAQRALLVEGAAAGLETSAMATALGISRQTAYSWLKR
ncbi:helix-turn-helix domain-containing protein [Pseudonocardia sp. CA-107938]|uniref:helix-turn-helix domain-containing protein n=1 Tax=Pseudonocardia sp. CA-107938 TaxID=3240021 RepID=UPI003D919CCB